MDDQHIITDLFPVQFHETEILARPFEFDDNSNPTLVTKSHTTCPECGNRVEIDHECDDNFIEKDGIRYTWCSNCENGQYFFESLRQWIRASAPEEEPEIPVGFYHDFDMIQTVDAIDWETTKLLLDQPQETIINQEEESIDDLVDAIVIEDE